MASKPGPNFQWTCPPESIDQPLVRTVSWYGTPPPGVVSPGLKVKGPGAHDMLVQLHVAFTLRAVSSAKDTTGASVLEKYLLVDLQNTTVSARPDGTPGDATTGSSGWYIDNVDVQIDFVDEVTGLARDQDQPQTQSLTGSSTSTISKTLTAGFFGDSLTGSYSQTWSNSFTIAMEDFRSTNNSGPASVTQHYKMEMTQSAKYSEPMDLLGGSNPLFSGSTSPLTLQVPPPKATSNLPIPTQALFVVPPGTESSARVRIRLTPTFVCVTPVIYPTYKELPAKFEQEVATLLAVESGGLALEADMPWGLYQVNTVNDTLEWTAEVDFSAVSLSS